MSSDDTLSVGKDEEVKLSLSLSSIGGETSRNGGSERGGGEMEEVAEIYGLSSMSREEMNRLLFGGKTIALPKKRSKALTPATIEERAGVTLRPHPSGGARAEPPQIEALAEFVPQPPPVQIDPTLREVGVVTHGMAKESSIPRQKSSFIENASKTAAKRFIRCTFLEVDLKRARHEVDKHGGFGIVCHTLETANLMNALAVEYCNCLKERNSFADKNDELNWEKLASSKAAIEAEVEKRKKSEEELAKARDELAEEVGVEEDGESKTVEFRLDITLSWERDEARLTMLPPSLEYEFVAIDEDGAKVPENTEVEDNIAGQEVD
ncbi:hypothetical protein SLEP1_g46826 [Rubroshorea leprosula]|uniref:Uncharacterized protein n=1 Tax=Rubroshorea leprosula TaxID=152421 RepID=A0AAV5LNG9_9ROSI|nr:hypothetical protein SLEP1_g46826 [Rubroshorea leprosula]